MEWGQLNVTCQHRSISIRASLIWSKNTKFHVKEFHKKIVKVGSCSFWNDNICNNSSQHSVLIWLCLNLSSMGATLAYYINIFHSSYKLQSPLSWPFQTFSSIHLLYFIKKNCIFTMKHRLPSRIELQASHNDTEHTLQPTRIHSCIHWSTSTKIKLPPHSCC